MKTVHELAVELKNAPGALSDVVEMLTSAGIKILGLSARIEGDIGIASLVTNDPSRAFNMLETAGYKVSTRDILVVEVPHHPGGMTAILKPLKLASVNVQNIYFLRCSMIMGAAQIMALKVDDCEKASEALSEEWIRMLGDEIYNW
ncbi:MAG: hypothetical protein PHS86_07020 [Syntrophaceae bacterium]|nr:hypothetical protein [Syntrophaceae bacterium]